MNWHTILRMPTTTTRTKTRAKATKAQQTHGSTIAGVPFTRVSFFDSLKVQPKTITTFCPFCNTSVHAKQKLYLMVCSKCGLRID